MVGADHRLVGRDDHDLEAVDLLELEGLGVRRAGHAGQRLVHAEVVLEGDRGERLVLLADLDALLGLDGLVQAVGPAPSRHGAAGELVDDHHLAVLDDVLHVAAVDEVRAQRRGEVLHEHDVARVVQALARLDQPGLRHQLLDLGVAGLGEEGLLGLQVHAEVAGAVLLGLRLEPGHQLVDAQVGLGAVLGRPGNDQRRARLVDQDRVHLVDDGEVQAALGALFEAEGEVVAQVVEAELVVGAVGDVGVVGGALVGRLLAGPDDPDRQAEGLVDRPHPVGVALRQVLVHRDDVHALARQGVEIGRQRGDQGLALAGAHFRDLALVQRHAADQLDVEVAHPEGPLGGLAGQREGLRAEPRRASCRPRPRPSARPSAPASPRCPAPRRSPPGH
jgi:hypothetical protein